MAITRRELAGILGATAAATQIQGAPQAEEEETRSAHEAMRQNAEQLDKVPLAMAIEPACHFKP